MLNAQSMAKEMEKKFWDDLQERLDEVKQNPLPYQYQKPEEAWRKLRKATSEDFDQSPDYKNYQPKILIRFLMQ